MWQCLANFQVSELVGWMDKYSETLEELQIGTLQELIRRLNQVTWSGTDIATFMRETLETR
jgi:hypothetical protein